MTSLPSAEPDSPRRRAAADFTATLGGVLLCLVGLFGILQGVAEIGSPDIYAADGDYLYQLDVSTWGWIHLITGVLGVLVAVGILLRTTWGQITGIIVASLSALTNFVFMPYFPFWGMTVIAFNLVVIWALARQLRTYS